MERPGHASGSGQATGVCHTPGPESNVSSTPAPGAPSPATDTAGSSPMCNHRATIRLNRCLERGDVATQTRVSGGKASRAPSARD